MNEPCYYRVSVKGLILDDRGRFVLFREDNGMWDLPGGGLEHGEDPIAGLKREIGEETGLSVASVHERPAYFTTGPRYLHDTFVANIIYKITLENLNFTPSEECQELRFLMVEEARKLPSYPTVGKFLDVFDLHRHLQTKAR
ncbi:MAG TPA: NUDIX hydrolase [Candidatus Saccharimonadales bacterium]